MNDSITWKIPSRWLGRLWVTGPDRISFLQGQSTPDLRRLEPGSVVFGAFLDPKGRVLANGWFAMAEEAILLVLAEALIEPMMAHLKRYILRAKVELYSPSDKNPLWLTESTEGQPDPADRPFQRDESGWRIHYPQCFVLIESSREDQGVGTVLLDGDSEALLLVRHGIPLITPETQAEYLPQMLALERFEGISYDKGCYTGQEIVTRTHFLGRVKRHLMRVHGDLKGHWLPGTPLVEPETQEVAGTLLFGGVHPNGGFSGLACLKEGVRCATARSEQGATPGEILTVVEL